MVLTSTPFDFAVDIERMDIDFMAMPTMPAI
jgi:hypothetical protein